MKLYLIVYQEQEDDTEWDWTHVVRPDMDQAKAEAIAMDYYCERRGIDEDERGDLDIADELSEVYFVHVDEVDGYKLDLIRL